MNENIVGARIGAFLIDGIIWGVIFTFFSAISGQVNTSNGVGVHLSGMPFLIYSLLWLAYYVGLETKLGGTIGKMILGITVVNNEGNRISVSQSLTRNLLRIVDAFPYFIPYIVGLIAISSSPTKQRLGDRAAHTYVVRP